MPITDFSLKAALAGQVSPARYKRDMPVMRQIMGMTKQSPEPFLAWIIITTISLLCVLGLVFLR